MAGRQTILVGRINRLAQKLFSMKGDAVVPDLSPEVFFAISMFHGAENRYLEGWDRFGIAIPVGAGGAGNRAAVRLRNPTNSGVVAVIEKATIYNAAAADAPQLTIGAVGTDLTTVSATIDRFDARGRIQSSLSLSSSGNSGAVTGTNIGQYGVPLGGNQEWIITDIQELPLLPGDGYTLWTNNLNAAFTAGFWWRERFLEDSERA